MARLWPATDERLLARVREGDAGAFEALYERHHGAILAFCLHLTRHREDAEDAVQHTFLAVYRAAVESDRPLELRAWLFTVARNRCLSLMRGRRARPETATELEADLAPCAGGPDGLVAEVERRQELRELVRDLGRLPEPQRAALVLSELDALSHREIGTVLGVAPAKVKSLVYQARTALATGRDAREAPCGEIREQLATLRGSALRRRTLRRHISDCAGCTEFEASVKRQRRDLASLLPVAAAPGLRAAVLGGSAGGGGALGPLAVLGGQGIVAKLAVVAVVAGAGAAAVELPDGPPPRALEVASATPGSSSGGMPAGGDTRSDGLAGALGGELGGGAPGGTRPLDPRNRPDGAPEPGAGTGDGAEGGGGAHKPGAQDAGAPPDDLDGGVGNGVGPGSPGGGDGGDGGSGEGLPPGLAKRDGLPPGLAKRDGLPPGLAKRGESPPGLAQKGRKPGRGNGNSKAGGGRGGSNGAGGNGNAVNPGRGSAADDLGTASPGGSNGVGGSGNAGGGGGNPNALEGGGEAVPGNANGGGPGHGGPGNGNGNAGAGNGSAGNGNGSTNGNANGNGNGNGNGAPGGGGGGGNGNVNADGGSSGAHGGP